MPSVIGMSRRRVVGLLEYLTEDIPRSARENLPNALNRGMVAGLLGGPVDIANIALLGAGGERPVGGSEWFGGLLEQAGAVTPRRGDGAEMAGELGASMMTPASAAKVAAASLPGLLWIMSQGGKANALSGKLSGQRGAMSPEGKSAFKSALNSVAAGKAPRGEVSLGDLSEHQLSELNRLRGKKGQPPLNSRQVIALPKDIAHIYERRVKAQGMTPDFVADLAEATMRPDSLAVFSRDGVGLLNRLNVKDYDGSAANPYSVISDGRKGNRIKTVFPKKK